MISRFFIEFYRVLRWKIVFRPLVFWAKVVVQTKFHCMQWVRPFSPLNKYWNKKKETSYDNLSSISGVVATVTIAFIMVGDINSLAPIVTMPFLLTYACIDYSYFALAQTFDIQTKREERFRIQAQSPSYESRRYGAVEHENDNDLDHLFPERTRHKLGVSVTFGCIQLWESMKIIENFITPLRTHRAFNQTIRCLHKIQIFQATQSQRVLKCQLKIVSMIKAWMIMIVSHSAVEIKIRLTVRTPKFMWPMTMKSPSHSQLFRFIRKRKIGTQSIVIVGFHYSGRFWKLSSWCSLTCTTASHASVWYS